MLFIVLSALTMLALFAYLVLWGYAYSEAFRIYLLVSPEASGRYAVIRGFRFPVCAEIPLRKERFAARMKAIHFERRLIPTYEFKDVRDVMQPV